MRVVWNIKNRPKRKKIIPPARPVKRVKAAIKLPKTRVFDG
jgi:hypothetical protein